MTRPSTNLLAIAAAILLTLATFQQAVSIPGGPSPIETAQLA